MTFSVWGPPLAEKHTARPPTQRTHRDLYIKRAMSALDSLVKAKRQAGLLRTRCTPAAHTHAVGTALGPSLRENPGRLRDM